jgi:hypothetical protein
MLGIDNAKSKLGWAKTHLDTLDEELRIFCNSPEPYAAAGYEDITNGLYVFSYRAPLIPPHICHIVGDAFYNMRSSLDQLVWALARLSKIPGNVQFPIMENTSTESKKRFTRQLKDVPSEAIVIIDELQPYHRGTAYKEHPLWRLDEMCNLDKHRRIPMRSASFEVRFPKLRPDGMMPHAMDDGMIITVPLARKHELEIYECQPIAVEFGGDTSGISETPKGIVEIYNFVANNVIPRFQRSFI